MKLFPWLVTGAILCTITHVVIALVGAFTAPTPSSGDLMVFFAVAACVLIGLALIAKVRE